MGMSCTTRFAPLETLAFSLTIKPSLLCVCSVCLFFSHAFSKQSEKTKRKMKIPTTPGRTSSWKQSVGAALGGRYSAVPFCSRSSTPDQKLAAQLWPRAAAGRAAGCVAACVLPTSRTAGSASRLVYYAVYARKKSDGLPEAVKSETEPLFVL